MPLNFNAIATIVTGLVEGAKIVSPHLGKPAPAPRPKPASTEPTRPDLTPRVAALESRQDQVDDLLQGLAEQLENVALAGGQLNRQVRILFAVAGLSLLISIGSLVIVLLRG